MNVATARPDAARRSRPSSQPTAARRTRGASTAGRPSRVTASRIAASGMSGGKLDGLTDSRGWTVVAGTPRMLGHRLPGPAQQGEVAERQAGAPLEAQPG